LAAPQAAHCCVLSQIAPDSQVVPQQGCPDFPHATHIDPAQTNPVPHVDPPQHIWSLPPHASHVPPLPHSLPAAQVDPPQQGCPGPPHVPQVPTDEQVTPDAVHLCPVQQASPVPPQCEQVPTRQTASPVQLSPAQQGRPTVPHATLSLPASMDDDLSGDRSGGASTLGASMPALSGAPASVPGSSRSERRHDVASSKKIRKRPNRARRPPHVIVGRMVGQ
jgi:hypothetical protein